MVYNLKLNKSYKRRTLNAKKSRVKSKPVRAEIGQQITGFWGDVVQHTNATESI